MPNTPNASFIPKQGPVRKVRQTASRQVQLLTVISYVLIVSTGIASLGVMLYNRYLTGKLENEVQKLNTTTDSFSEADMDTVREFNLRLHQAQTRLDKSVSITSIFDAMEKATIQSAQISELSITRDSDTQVYVNAKVKTGSFDASLFQRGVYEKNSIIKNVEIDDLTLTPATEKDSVSGVSFVAKITVPVSDILYKPADVNTASNSASETASTTEATINANQASETASSSLKKTEDTNKVTQ